MAAQPFVCPRSEMIPSEILRRVVKAAKDTIGPRIEGRRGTDKEAPAPEPQAPATQVIRPEKTSTSEQVPTKSSVPDGYSEPGEITDLGVLLMPLAEYHGKELGAVGDALTELGHRCSYLVREPLVGVVDPYLGDHPRILAAEGYDRFALGSFDSFVAMNDWGEPSRAIYHLARVRDVPSFSKVEGVQDFTDVDTGRIRLPYLAADHVLVQGNNDVEALDRKNLHMVGNSNMESAWREGPRPGERNGEVIINSNFTYGVLLEARDQFLAQAVQSITSAGLTPVISQHPVDRPLPKEFAELKSDRSMSEMLPGAEALVTRFSTVPFEAIAYGTPFVYFNPHNEKVPTFRGVSPAFEHVHTGTELTGALKRAVDKRANYREIAEPYFRAQIDMTEESSALRSARAIAAVTYENPQG